MARKTPYFQCPDCRRKSYNPNDIEHRYCGVCHEFFPEPPDSIQRVRSVRSIGSPTKIDVAEAIAIAQAEYDYWMQFQNSKSTDKFMAAVVGGGACANIIAALMLGKTPEQFRQQIAHRSLQLPKQPPKPNDKRTKTTHSGGAPPAEA